MRGEVSVWRIFSSRFLSIRRLSCRSTTPIAQGISSDSGHSEKKVFLVEIRVPLAELKRRALAAGSMFPQPQDVFGIRAIFPVWTSLATGSGDGFHLSNLVSSDCVIITPFSSKENLTEKPLASRAVSGFSPQKGHYLDFQIYNQSSHDLSIRDAELPWNFPWGLDIRAIPVGWKREVIVKDSVIADPLFKIKAYNLEKSRSVSGRVYLGDLLPGIEEALRHGPMDVEWTFNVPDASGENIQTLEGEVLLPRVK